MTAKVGNPLFRDMPTTVFEVMSQLALKHKSINLGQGFPDDRGPPDVLQAAADALLNGYNQYPSMMGTPELRQAVANHAKRFYGLDVDWAREVLVTSGATEALGACLFGLIEPGDEVVLFEPMYDSYLPIIRQAGGIPRLVTLKAPDWSFTREDLERVFSPRTKAIVINNPLNPVGKVYRRDELELIGEFLQRFDAYADLRRGLRASGVRWCGAYSADHAAGAAEPLPEGRIGRQDLLADRLEGRLCDGGAGTASARRQGAPVPDLHDGAQPSGGCRLWAGEGPTSISTIWRRRCRPSATGWRRACATAGLSVLHSGGSYFLLADISSVGFDGDDVAFCLHLTEAAGVTAIPVSAFFAETPVRNYIRFCFCKQDALLDEAIGRLEALFLR